VSETNWQALAERYESGETFEDLALDIGRSAPYVRQHLRGLITPRPQGERAGVPRRRDSPRRLVEGSGSSPDARIVRPSVARIYR
jgi:hypothetical protein